MPGPWLRCALGTSRRAALAPVGGCGAAVRLRRRLDDVAAFGTQVRQGLVAQHRAPAAQVHGPLLRGCSRGRPHGDGGPAWSHHGRSVLGRARDRLLRLLGAHLAALGGKALPRVDAGPVGAQPLPRVLERTATDFTAFGHAGMVVQETDRRESEVAEEVWEADGAVATGDAAEADGSDATPRGVEWSEYTALHSFEGQQGEVSQHGQSAPLAVPRPQLGSCASAGRAWRLWAARHSREEACPQGAQPQPRMLELAASKAADATAFL